MGGPKKVDDKAAAGAGEQAQQPLPQEGGAGSGAPSGENTGIGTASVGGGAVAATTSDPAAAVGAGAPVAPEKVTTREVKPEEVIGALTDDALAKLLADRGLMILSPEALDEQKRLAADDAVAQERAVADRMAAERAAAGADADEPQSRNTRCRRNTHARRARRSCWTPATSTGSTRTRRWCPWS
jgi:hypothetical protein